MSHFSNREGRKPIRTRTILVMFLTLKNLAQDLFASILPDKVLKLKGKFIDK